MQVKAKDLDLDRLKKRINRRNAGGNGEDTASNYGSRRGRDDRSSSSRHSRLGAGRNDVGQGYDLGMDNIPERDAFLEDTGKYDPNNIGGPQISPAQVHLPKMNNLNNKRKLNEWEEAFEMDRLLEQERNV